MKVQDLIQVLQEVNNKYGNIDVHYANVGEEDSTGCHYNFNDIVVNSTPISLYTYKDQLRNSQLVFVLG